MFSTERDRAREGPPDAWEGRRRASPDENPAAGEAQADPERTAERQTLRSGKVLTRERQPRVPEPGCAPGDPTETTTSAAFGQKRVSPGLPATADAQAANPRPAAAARPGPAPPPLRAAGGFQNPRPPPPTPATGRQRPQRAQWKRRILPETSAPGRTPAPNSPRESRPADRPSPRDAAARRPATCGEPGERRGAGARCPARSPRGRRGPVGLWARGREARGLPARGPVKAVGAGDLRRHRHGTGSVRGRPPRPAGPSSAGRSHRLPQPPGRRRSEHGHRSRTPEAAPASQ